MSVQQATTEYRSIYRKPDAGARGGKPYVVRWRERGVQRNKAFHTLEEAVAHQAAQRQKPLGVMPFEAYAVDFLATYRGRTMRGVTDETLASYADLIRRFAVPFFKSQPINEIGPRDFKEFIDWLASRRPALADNTIKRIAAVVRVLLNEAFEDELTTRRAGKVRVVVQGERRTPKPKTLTRKEMAAILVYLHPRDALLFEFLSLTGLRISEALDATWADYCQGDEGPVLVIRKGKTEASENAVALVPQANRLLMRHREETPFGEDHHPIFASRVGTRQDDHNIRTRLRKVTHALGMPWATPHKLRHSLATELLDHGMSIADVAAVLRHANPSTTVQFYVHGKSAPRFDALIGESR